MLFLILLCVFGLWLYWGYLTVIKVRNDAYDCFNDVDNDLRKKYELMTNIISLSKRYMPKEQTLIQTIINLQEEVTGLGNSPEFMNRRIALDKELENKSDELIAAIKNNAELLSNSSIENSINAYQEISNCAFLSKKDFNSSAKKLRKAVEEFPSSFMARLNNIKSIDYMK